MSNTFDKLSVLNSFIEEVNSYLPEIKANLECLAQSPGDMDALEETYRRTHTIGGSASMMDFSGLAHVAHGMEDILADALDGITILDEPTIGLLSRSLERVQQLLGGIRNGIDEDAVIAEDDADYEHYRAKLEASEQAVSHEADRSDNSNQAQSSIPSVSAPTSFDMLVHVSPPSSPSIPSFDEVLASFRTPTLTSEDDIVWPEEHILPSAASYVDDDITPPSEDDQLREEVLPRSGAALPSPQVLEPPSALETLIASTRSGPSSPVPHGKEETPQSTEEQSGPLKPQSASVAPLLPVHDLSDSTFSHVYTEMEQSTQALEVQASSLKGLLEQLRFAMSVVDGQRSEFKGFLDGSKDALDRMEEWAGRAMGLNLRNSPEQVRRYLPLSVMWVANSKLKKVLDLLRQITGGIEVTDEQMYTILRQLHSSIESCNEMYQQMEAKATHLLTQESGWTPWEVHATHDSSLLRERVTFERYGDLASLRTEIEEEVREEMRREYEMRPLSLATLTEMEQQIRKELRQEFEARLSSREQVAPARYESQQELEARLRDEIEIEVRQSFLAHLNSGAIDVAALRAGSASIPATPAVVDRTYEIGHAERLARAMNTSKAVVSTSRAAQQEPSTLPVALSKPLVSPPHIPVAEPQASSFSTSGGDLSEEAAEIFRLEAEEHLQTISMHVAALEKEPTNRELIQGIRRATHTLKGAAGMMGFRAIADICHVSEDLLDSIMEGTTPISSVVLSIILDTAEMLDGLITGRGVDEAKLQALRLRHTDLLGEVSTPFNVVDYDVGGDAGEDLITDSTLVARMASGEQSHEVDAPRTARGDLSVRVPLQKLDELVNLFGELLVNRSVLEERLERLVRLVSDVEVSSNRLREVGQKLESNFEAATLPSGGGRLLPADGKLSTGFALGRKGGKDGKNGAEPSHLAEFDELELDRYTEFHRLARGLSEGISDMGTLSGEMDAIIRECQGVFSRENRLSMTFQDRLMKTRLVPLSTMVPRLYRSARAVAFKQQKEFEFVLEGEGTEVDRTVYEEIAGPLLHLMRNAVNHALETPEERTRKGKPPAGQIKLSAAYEGNQVVITVRDDGRGIDPEHIRHVAIARGLIRSDQMLSESGVIDLIFRPGFSTAEVLSEESGRGVGLDVVRDSVARLRGTIEVESMPGQGTAFTMKFPTSLAIQSAMMVKVAGQQFAIPTIMVEAIGRLDNFKRSTVAGQPAIIVRNDLYPLTMLAHYLSLPDGTIEEKSPLLLINAGGHRVALAVNEIKGKLDVVTKNLGPHLRQVHGVAGGTVLGNGQVVLILELTELLAMRSKSVASVASALALPSRREGAVSQSQMLIRQTVDITADKRSPGMKLPTTPTPLAEHGKHVLIVDDSPSVRRVVGNMLKQHGWEIQMARDGVEALEMITRETPAAVLLDIEMPRMDGYELIATVRSQEQYRMLPLVILTSRAAAKHQQRALQLGANAYVVKPYQDEDLLNTLSSLVYGGAMSVRSR
ncbi:MAG TPA: response regulator [Ktedonobacteraceae bacterium]|jgi:chemotaxis protein histidine kinase CheA/ActR/RegA family two-component response regulator|nr:response regulator [Ktedonobacteraceae bacterium]